MEGSGVLFKGICHTASWAQDGNCPFGDEFHLITLTKSKAPSDGHWHGNLALTADSAGLCYLYLHSLL